METVISIISLITSVIALITALLPLLINKKKKDFEGKYNQFRNDVAAALTMYACYYHNPVDLAKLPNKELPQDYEMASYELRKLGSTASALSEIVSTKKKKLSETKNKLSEVSRCLIGLSNSMHTPYNCGFSRDERDAVNEYERSIKKALEIGS